MIQYLIKNNFKLMFRNTWSVAVMLLGPILVIMTLSSAFSQLMKSYEGVDEFVVGFCGVCVAHSVIEEQNNKVFTRIMLTKTNSQDYFISKFVVALIVSMMQMFVLGICLCFIPKLDVGMSIMSFLIIIFLLGLIFSTLSLLLGVALGDVMSSNYAVFAVWSISALLAGLYFPLEDTTKALKALSYLMPQRWFMNASELLLTGDKSAYSMVLCVTVAYLIMIVSIGAVGIKIKRYE